MVASTYTVCTFATQQVKRTPRECSTIFLYVPFVAEGIVLERRKSAHGKLIDLGQPHSQIDLCLQKPSERDISCVAKFCQMCQTLVGCSSDSEGKQPLWRTNSPQELERFKLDQSWNCTEHQRRTWCRFGVDPHLLLVPKLFSNLHDWSWTGTYFDGYQVCTSEMKTVMSPTTWRREHHFISHSLGVETRTADLLQLQSVIPSILKLEQYWTALVRVRHCLCTMERIQSYGRAVAYCALMRILGKVGSLRKEKAGRIHIVTSWTTNKLRA